MQAALGSSQLGRLDDYVEVSRANAAYLTNRLSDLAPLQLPHQGLHSKSSYWKYVCQITNPINSDCLEDFLGALRAEGVPAFPRYPVPLDKQPVFARISAGQHCGVTDGLKSQLFSLPVHPGLRSEDLDNIAIGIEKVLASTRYGLG